MPQISFAVADPAASRLLTRAETVAAVLLIVAGFALRGYAAVNSFGIVHPDEHQQYLEQANRLAYGYGATYWEQARGMRSYLYPGALAGCLLAFDACGITDPIGQAAGIRMILSAMSFVVLIGVAWRFFREGQPIAAAIFLALVALSPFMVFISVRALSETVAIAPLFLALLLIPRRPGWAGVMLGITFPVRFQTGILIAAIFGLLLVECLRGDGRHWRKMARLLGGFCMTMLALGWLDRVTLGNWFQSPVEYVRANIVEHGAAAFGVKPWNYYLDGYVGLFGAFPLVGLCVVAGVVREWRLAVAALVYIAVHSAIGHKESRFLWTLAPAACVLSAAGLQLLWTRIGQRTYQFLAVGLVIFNVAWVEAISFSNIPWNRKPYVDSALALTTVGRRDDVTGVAVCDGYRVVAGNYFYLRRPVPLIMDLRTSQLVRYLDDHREINYLIADPTVMSEFEKWQPVEVGRVGDVGIYLLSSPGSR
jgi:phosphatidylinositol glycan class B